MRRAQVILIGTKIEKACVVCELKGIINTFVFFASFHLLFQLSFYFSFEV